MIGAPNWPATQTPTANSIPIAKADGKIDVGWLPDTVATDEEAVDLEGLLDGVELLAHKDQPDGYAGLGGDGLIPGNLITYGDQANTAAEGNDPRFGPSDFFDNLVINAAGLTVVNEGGAPIWANA